MARKDARSTNVVSATQPAPNWKRRLAYAVTVVAVIALCVAIRAIVGTTSATAQIPNPFSSKPAQQQAAAPARQPAQPAEQASAEMPRPERPQHDVMAVVNGQDIRRDALANACVERFGEE